MRKDTVKGELVFRGKVGQHIEEKRDKKDQPYTMFSAFSTEKVENGFEYQWVRFFCFGKEREAWLQPGVRVDAKGEISYSGSNVSWLAGFQAYGMTDQELWDFMCHKAKVATDDGPKFGPNGEAGGFQRINFSCPRAQLEEALNRIAEALDAL